MSSSWLTNRFQANSTYPGMMYTGVNSVAVTTLDLTDVYTYNSAGRAACVMCFFAPETGTITDFWFKVSSYTGTWASTDGNLNWEIREGYLANYRPAANLIASGAVSTGGATGYIKVSGQSISITYGKLYSLIIYDADGNATNYATVVAGLGSTDGNFGVMGSTHTTTAGWTGSGTTTGKSGCGCIKITDGSANIIYISGQIWTAVNTVTSNTLARGCCFSTKDYCTLVGSAVSTDTDVHENGWSVKLYASGTSPGGTALTEYVSPTGIRTGGTAPSCVGIIWPRSAWYDLLPNTFYRLVWIPISNKTVPRKVTIDVSPDAELLAASRGFGGDLFWTEESGGAWSNNTEAIANAGPILVPTTLTASTNNVIVITED